MINTAMKWKGRGVKGHLDLVGYYNANCLAHISKRRYYKMSMSDNWCAMFTSCIADMCGLGADEFPYEVSVAEQVKLAKERGWFIEESSKAVPNSLAFFDWKGNGVYSHVGIVTANDGRTITTLEGNHNGDVAPRTLPCESKFFAGFAYSPDFESEGREGGIQELVVRTLKGEFGVGEERKRRLGDKYKEVQKFINGK